MGDNHCGITPRFTRADGEISICQPYEAPILLDLGSMYGLQPHCPHCLRRVAPGPNRRPPPPPAPAPVTEGCYRSLQEGK